MNNWLVLITTLPTENATVRMRVWRSLKTSGAAVLRDGVYLMPERETCGETLGTIANEVRSSGGTALVLRVEEPGDGNFVELFERSTEFSALLTDIVRLNDELSVDTALDTLKQSRKLHKAFSNLVAIDFFPGEAQRQTEAALNDLEFSVVRILSPDEPHSIQGSISLLSSSEYQGRTWATVVDHGWIGSLVLG